MKMRISVLIFTLACLVLITSLLLGFLSQGDNSHTIAILLGSFGTMFTALVVMGIFLGGKERWTVFTLVATLLLLFSAAAIFSMGLFIAPVALLLLGFSLWKSRRIRLQVKKC
jgi:hypothetical protein